MAQSPRGYREVHWDLLWFVCDGRCYGVVDGSADEVLQAKRLSPPRDSHVCNHVLLHLCTGRVLPADRYVCTYV